MSYTEFDKKCDEAALGCSFSHRTRLLVWVMKHTWPLWRKSARAKAYFAATLAKTLVAPRKGEFPDNFYVSLHTSDPTAGDPGTEVSYAGYARRDLNGNVVPPHDDSPEAEMAWGDEHGR